MILVLAVGLMALILALVRPKWAAYALAFFSPWIGLDADLGVAISPYRLVAAGLMLPALVKVASAAPSSRRRIGRAVGLLVLFGGYAIGMTLLTIPFLPDFQGEAGTFRGTALRPAAQCAMFLLQLCPVVAALAYLRTPRDILRLGTTYLAAATILALLGMVQFAVWVSFGVDLMPIGYVNAALGGPAIPHSATMGPNLLRVCAFGGEPKRLAQSLALAMLILQARWAIAGAPFTRRSIQLWLTNAVGMVLTWSTSGFFLWTGGTLAMQFLTRVRSRKIAAQVAVLVLAAGTLFVVGSMSTEGDKSVSDMVMARTVERGVIEGFDDAVLSWLGESPEHAFLGVGLGNVHFYATPYLPPEIEHFAVGTAFVAKSGYLRMLSEIGVVGLLLFLGMCLASLRSRPLPAHRQLFSLVRGVAFLIMVAYLARVYISDQFWLALGALLATACLTVPSRKHQTPRARAQGPNTPGPRLNHANPH